MKKTLLLLLSLCTLYLSAQRVDYTDSWDKQGFNLKSQSDIEIKVNYSITEFFLNDIEIRGEQMKYVTLPGHFLPNDEGAPNLPGSGRFIAIPEGATPILRITGIRTETLKDISVAPAPRIPKTTDRGPLHYEKNDKIYSTDAFYPAEPVKLSEKMEIRGIDVAMLGITPFQYNPVTRELKIIRDLKIEVDFEGGQGVYGEERLRSKWWDPIIEDAVLNSASITEVDYTARFYNNNRDEGYEYLIIIPDNPVFQPWADTIKKFRVQQGITTKIVTTGELGGNSTAAIESYVNEAYNNWDPAPSAVLLLGDYASGDDGIMSPIWDSYCASDHIYADIDGDDIEDVVFARITAQNSDQLETMIMKFINHETNPPTDPNFYNHPITALGWQTERWFQLCSETVGGYFKEIHGKDPVRINAVYGGNPSVDPWSTAPNTATVLNVFGPNGLGYIPEDPSDLGGWTGGTSYDVTAAINNGAFILQHRDHGYEYGWGEPDYNNDDIDDLTNTDLCFVFSINCLTGKYNMTGECFTEKFHRHTYNGQPSGALGLIAASEVSYSFVNDTYVWGLFDNMFTDFLPEYGTTPESRGMLPAFGNTAGKYFLMQSNWPYNTGNKEVTYNLFHHHGDAFLQLYSEVPQYLTVDHNEVVLAGLDYFSVMADEGATIALSVDGELIGVAEGTGSYQDVLIDPQLPPSVVDVVVTKENYFRYHEQVDVIPPNGAYIVNNAYEINDESGNNNGQLDYAETVTMSLTLKNIGNEDATNVTATITSEDEFVTIDVPTVAFGDIASNQAVTVNEAFTFTAAGNIPNGHTILFDIVSTDGDSTWTSKAQVQAHAPILEFVEFMVDDAAGNNNGRIDPEETADIIVSLKNAGSSDAYDVLGALESVSPFLSVDVAEVTYGEIGENMTLQQTFTVTAAVITPPGHLADLNLGFTGMHGIEGSGSFTVPVGQFPVLILDLDNNANSGPAIMDALLDWGVGAEYKTTFEPDISDYEIIFVCLGTYNQNHILTYNEGVMLKNYLMDGGNLYMEGADTWYYDQQTNATPVHPLFSINGLSDGSTDLYLIKGQDGTLTDGMNYIFTGDNNYIDHIDAYSPAYAIFKNNSPLYTCAVAYDADIYKTIGTSFEFGGLNDNTLNSKKSLMLKYLQFFGLDPLTEKPGTPSGEGNICGSGHSADYSTTAIEGADYYIWQIDPPEAGTVNGYTEEVSINWSAEFTGEAMLSVCGMNAAGLGPLSDTLLVSVHELPNAICELSTDQICEGDTAMLYMTLSGQSPWTMLINVGGGTFEFDITKPNMDPWKLNPDETIDLYIESIIDGNGCVQTEGFEVMTLNVMPLPDKPSVPQGEAEIDTYVGTSFDYEAENLPEADSYIWELTPPEAGSIISGETEAICTVEWIDGYLGQAELKVKGVNECGEGEFSQSLMVDIANSFGIDDNEGIADTRIYPNPNNGKFHLEIPAAEKGKYRIYVLSSYGVNVYEEKEVELNESSSLEMDLSHLPKGVYFVFIGNDKFSTGKKFVINR